MKNIYEAFKKKSILIKTLALIAVFAILPIAVANADDITILAVKAVPSTGTLNVGQTLEVDFHHPDQMTDITSNGSCTINGKDVGPLQNLTNGDYKLTYTVVEGDTDRAAGQVPFSCALTNAAGQMDTLTAFTDGNTVAISGHAATTTTTTATTTDTTNNNNNTTGGSTTDGNINGNVQGGSTAVDNGTLAITSIEQLNTTAQADGTFDHGWKWLFHITVPSNETSLQLKFGNWIHTNGTNTISPANNMRISSTEASFTGPTLIEGVDTYSTPLTITGDLNGSLPGKQINVIVETGVPVGSLNGSYSASYHIKSSAQ